MEVRLLKDGRLRSDDFHVIALAKTARVRLLYMKDVALMRDFTNKRIINSPRGKVYSSSRNRRFLDRSYCR